MTGSCSVLDRLLGDSDYGGAQLPSNHTQPTETVTTESSDNHPELVFADTQRDSQIGASPVF